MNHANIQQLMLCQQRSYNKTYRIVENTGGTTGVLELILDYGIKVFSYPSGHWTAVFSSTGMNVASMDVINLLTPADFVITKKAARKFCINGEDWITEKSVVKFAPDGSHEYESGVILGEDLKEGTKALHKLTRRVRKKVQPQLRLLGPEPFKRKDGKRSYYRDNSGGDQEINALVGILDGDDIIQNMIVVRDACNLGWDFGCQNYRGHAGTFAPKVIIDKILRRVGANKLAILEKYDERERAGRSRANA